MSRLSVLLLLSAALCSIVHSYSVQAPVTFVTRPNSPSDISAQSPASDPRSDRITSGDRRSAAKKRTFREDRPSVLQIFSRRLKSGSAAVMPSSAEILWYETGLPTSARTRPLGQYTPDRIQRRRGQKKRKGRERRKGRKGRKGRRGRKDRKYNVRRGKPETRTELERTVVPRQGDRRISGPQQVQQDAPAPLWDAIDPHRRSSASRHLTVQRKKIRTRRRRLCRRLRRRRLKTMPSLPAKLLRTCRRIWRTRDRLRALVIPTVPAGHMYVGPQQFRPQRWRL